MGLTFSTWAHRLAYQAFVGSIPDQTHAEQDASGAFGPAPDYADPANWAARGTDAGPAEVSPPGFPIAQYCLGVMFYGGYGVAQSYDEAMRWYRLAAAQGQPKVLYNLGACHANGQGVPRELNEALRFFKRAAAKGGADAAAAVDKLQASLAAAHAA